MMRCMCTAAQIHVETSDSASNYTYGMYFSTAACRFWNESADSWDTAGCQVRLGHRHYTHDNSLYWWTVVFDEFVS